MKNPLKTVKKKTKQVGANTYEFGINHHAELDIFTQLNPNTGRRVTNQVFEQVCGQVAQSGLRSTIQPLEDAVFRPKGTR